MLLRRAEQTAAIAWCVAAPVFFSACVEDIPPPREVPPGFVTTWGTDLWLDDAPFQFKGLNIYNANSRGSCWYAMAEGDLLDESLRAIGPESQNVFRAWFFQQMATTDGARDWSAFDHTLEVARARGQRVVVTFADQWAACEGPEAAYKDLSWYQFGYVEVQGSSLTSYRGWVEEVVTRYRDDPTVLMWQLMNEAEANSGGREGPCEPDAAGALRAWAEDMAHLVKSVDPHHLLSIGTIGTGQCGTSGGEYEALHDLDDVDLCEYHDYGSSREPMPGDRWNGLATRLEQCGDLGRPLFVGESGIEADVAARHQLFDDKLSEQLAAGVVGVLLWEWRAPGEEGGDDFVISAEDPVLEVLARY